MTPRRLGLEAWPPETMSETASEPYTKPLSPTCAAELRLRSDSGAQLDVRDMAGVADVADVGGVGVARDVREQLADQHQFSAQVRLRLDKQGQESARRAKGVLGVPPPKAMLSMSSLMHHKPDIVLVATPEPKPMLTPFPTPAAPGGGGAVLTPTTTIPSPATPPLSISPYYVSPPVSPERDGGTVGADSTDTNSGGFISSGGSSLETTPERMPNAHAASDADPSPAPRPWGLAADGGVMPRALEAHLSQMKSMSVFNTSGGAAVSMFLAEVGGVGGVGIWGVRSSTICCNCHFSKEPPNDLATHHRRRRGAPVRPARRRATSPRWRPAAAAWPPVARRARTRRPPVRIR